MQSHFAQTMILVYGLRADWPDPLVLGVVNVDRSGPQPVYTAQNDSTTVSSLDWPTIAAWVQRESGHQPEWVLVGKVFRPEWLDEGPDSDLRPRGLVGAAAR